MKLYKKQIMAIKVMDGGQSFGYEKKPITDWMDEDSVTDEMRSEWESSVKDTWWTLEYRERYVEVKNSTTQYYQALDDIHTRIKQSAYEKLDEFKHARKE